MIAQMPRNKPCIRSALVSRLPIDFTRVFAPEDCNDSYHTMREWSGIGPYERFEIRGGSGDEIYYSDRSNEFAYSIGSGLAPYRILPNPCPTADLIASARMVSQTADEDWNGCLIVSANSNSLTGVSLL